MPTLGVLSTEDCISLQREKNGVTIFFLLSTIHTEASCVCHPYYNNTLSDMYIVKCEMTRT